MSEKGSAILDGWFRALGKRRTLTRATAVASAALLIAYLSIGDPNPNAEVMAAISLLVVTMLTALAFSPLQTVLLAIPAAIAVARPVYIGDGSQVTAIGVGIGFVFASLVVSTLAAVNHRLRSTEMVLDEQQVQLARSFDTSSLQLRRQRALITCSKALLVPGEEGSLEFALLKLAEATGADGAAIWKNEDLPEVGVVARNVGWCAVADSGLERPAQTIPWSRFPNMMSKLSSGRVASFTSRDQIPYPDRAGFDKASGIESALELPVMVDGRWKGMVTAFSTGKRPQWSTEDISLLNTVADMVAVWWSREETVVRLHDVIVQRDHSLEMQSALIDSSRTLLEHSEQDPVPGVLGIIREALGADVAYLADFYNDDALGPAVRRTHEVTNRGISTVPAEPIAWSARPYAFEALAAGRPYVFDDARDLPDRERNFYAKIGDSTVAEVAFPVQTDDQILAVVGVGAYAPRAWGPGEVRTVGTVARMLATYAQRSRDREALEGLVSTKDRFIASVSHELRTPMAVVMGLSSELATRRADFTEAEVTEFIDLIARQSMDVSHIIEDLLVSTRVQEVGITVIPEPMRLDDQVREVLADLPQEYTFKIDTLELEPALVMADPRRVRQVVRNLITNSHRHGGDQVTITVRANADTAELIVADNGLGLKPDQQQHVFEAYSTFTTTTGLTPTIGLGLTVSFQLARLMKGSITYQAVPSPRFVLELPLVSNTESREVVRI